MANNDSFPARLLHESDASLAERVDSWHQRNPAPSATPAALKVPEGYRLVRSELRDEMVRMAASPAALTVPAAITDWHAAWQAHVDAVATYNARVAFARANEGKNLGSISVQAEYQLMDDAKRKVFASLPALFAGIGSLLAGSPADQGEDAHPDGAAVDRFAAAMKAKMAASRVKGRAGWDDPEQCAPEFLASMLIDHLHKGDPVDVGNFAMMLFNRPDARGVLAQVWATRYGQDAASPAKCDGTVSNCPNECSAPCSPSELPAMTDAQIETMLQIREHEPTIFIEDEILSNYDEMREEVWEAIKVYADIHARAALQQCRALLAAEKKCTRCEYIGHCDCEVTEGK